MHLIAIAVLPGYRFTEEGETDAPFAANDEALVYLFFVIHVKTPGAVQYHIVGEKCQAGGMVVGRGDVSLI